MESRQWLESASSQPPPGVRSSEVPLIKDHLLSMEVRLVCDREFIAKRRPLGGCFCSLKFALVSHRYDHHSGFGSTYGTLDGPDQRALIHSIRDRMCADVGHDFVCAHRDRHLALAALVTSANIGSLRIRGSDARRKTNDDYQCSCLHRPGTQQLERQPKTSGSTALRMTSGIGVTARVVLST